MVNNLRAGRQGERPARRCAGLLQAAAALLFFGSGGAAAAQEIVVRASGPSAGTFPVGRKIEGGARITLRQADRITVLGAGGTQVLEGPGTFTIGARTQGNPAALNERLASFINRTGSNRVRTGAVRGAGEDPSLPPPNPNVWFLDVTRPGTFCSAGSGALMAWRPDMAGPESLAIITAAGSPAATLEWRAGSRIKAWPADTAPPTDGTSYRLAPPGKSGGITVTFAVLAGPPAEFEALVPLLIEKGCTGQLDLLVAAVESAAQD